MRMHEHYFHSLDFFDCVRAVVMVQEKAQIGAYYGISLVDMLY